MMIVGRIETWQNQLAGPVWEKVFKGISEISPDAAPGKYPIDGEDIYLILNAYETRDRAQAKLEAHREYLDIQVSLRGEEFLEWLPNSCLAVKTPYVADRDVEFFEIGDPGPVQVRMTPGTFVVLYPEDAHLTQVMTDGRPAPIVKAVVKLRKSLVLDES